MRPALEPNNKLAPMIHAICFTQFNVFEVFYLITQISVFKELAPLRITVLVLIYTSYSHTELVIGKAKVRSG